MAEKKQRWLTSPMPYIKAIREHIAKKREEKKTKKKKKTIRDVYTTLEELKKKYEK